MPVPLGTSMNIPMARLLESEQPRGDEIPSDLLRMLSLGFVEKYECVFLRALENTVGDFDPRAHFDRTRW